MIVFDPAFPEALIIGVGAAATIAAGVAYLVRWREAGRLRRFGLFALRLVIVAAIVTVLMRPMRVANAAGDFTRPLFAVLVDTSASMVTPDGGGSDGVRKITRFERARAEIEGETYDLMTELAKNYSVSLMKFSSQAEATDFDQLRAIESPKDLQTDIGAALEAAAAQNSGRRLGGVLVLSDGRVTGGAAQDGALQAAQQLRLARVPVFTTTIGAETSSRDLYLTARVNQNFVFIRQPAKIIVNIAGAGYEGYYAKVNLYREDKLEKSEQAVIRGGAARVEFPMREEIAGNYRYRAEIEPLVGEADPANNRRTVFVRVLDQKTRVLLVESRPYWDSKFLLRALQRDPNLDVASIFCINDDKTFAIAPKSPNDADQSETPTLRMPRTIEDLHPYDCIIFGRDVDKSLTPDELRLFRDYLVERGGGIIFSRGRAWETTDTDLTAIEPLDWSEEFVNDVRLELTPQGRTNPAFSFTIPKSSDLILRELPELVSITRVEREKAMSVILARAQGEGADPEPLAAVAYQRFGRGKVMSIGAAGLWRWSFMPERLKEYDEVYQKFWSQLIRWMVSDSDFLPGQDLSFRASKNNFDLAEQVQLTITTKLAPNDFAAKITVISPDGEKTQLAPGADADQPGVFNAWFVPEKEGEYEAIMENTMVEPKRDAVRFTVYSDQVETRLLSPDPDLMRQIAETTGGAALPPERWNELPQQLSDFERATADIPKPVDAWDIPPVFLLIMGLLSIEWFLRRMSGLV